MGWSFVVHPLLAMGSAPPERGPLAHNFDVLVLCAFEFQPSVFSFSDVRVLHVPLDDANPSLEEIKLARQAGRNVAMRVSRGQRVLVTCYAGRNRSGLVTALALMNLGVPCETAIRRIRRSRKDALTNNYFVGLLRQLEQTNSNINVCINV